MPERQSKLSLLHPKWVLLLLAVIAADIAMYKLGRWQWHAGRRGGDITNYSYALQWWSFCGFAVLMYARLIRDHLRKVPGEQAAPAPEPSGPPRYLAYVPASSTQADDDDPERARWNQRLAALYAADPDPIQRARPSGPSPRESAESVEAVERGSTQ